VVFVGLGDNLVGPGYRRGKDRVALFLLPDIHEYRIAGLHPLHEVFVPLGYSPDVLLFEDFPVVPVGGGDPVGHMIESFTPHNIRFVLGSIFRTNFSRRHLPLTMSISLKDSLERPKFIKNNS